MMRTRLRRNAGVSLLEFALIGPCLLLITLTLFEMCLAMWQYETLAYAVREGARYTATKGQGCNYSGNSCGVTVGSVATQIANAAPGLDPGTMNITLSSSGGSSVTCNPLNSCNSNSTAWPPSSGNTELSSTVTVTGTYPFNLFFLHPRYYVGTSSGNLQASSCQLIEF
jgi:Flp pilus assembly protein TadG